MQAVEPRPGSPMFAPFAGAAAPPDRAALDTAVTDVARSAPRWAALSIRDRIELLDRLLADCAELASGWVATSARAQGIVDDPDAVGQEWISGPYVTLRYLRNLRRSLQQIADGGRIRLPAVGHRPLDGRTVVRLAPSNAYERLFFPGVTVEVVMAPGVTESTARAQAGFPYQGGAPSAGTTVVLGAGNVTGMAPIDSLHELFVANHTVALKMNPVNDYIAETIGRGLRALIEPGFLRIVGGGPEVGAYLCDHLAIDAIRLTGSDKTYEAIVYGSDERTDERKARGEPLRRKPVRAELGGVGPAIVVPGRWTERELAQGAGLVATMAYDHAGFSCGATDLLVLPDAWPQREAFLDALRAALSAMPLRPAYYPGARERYASYVGAHATVETFGRAADGKLPWAFIRHLDPADSDEMCFRREPFCPLFAELTLAAPDLSAYLERAVEFANDRVWGTLGVSLLVPGSIGRDRTTAASVERAVAGLRYGAIAINYHPSASWVLGTTPWGGYQDPAIPASESGVGFSQNAMLLRDTEKTIVRAPLGEPFPPPVWLAGRGTAACRTFERLCRFEARPSALELPGIVVAGLGR